MPDELPEDNGAKRFGRRPRQGGAPSGGSEQQSPKPKVRIGPRRGDIQPPKGDPVPGYQPLMSPRDPQKPMGGVRKAAREKARGQNGGQGRSDRNEQGGHRRKGRKDRFRPKKGPAPAEPRPQDEQLPAQGDLFSPDDSGFDAREPDSSGHEAVADSGETERPAGQGQGQGLSRNARRRKRRKDRRAAGRAPDAPSSSASEADVFEPAGDLDMPSSDDADLSFEEDESDLNLVEMPPPSGDRRVETREPEGDDDGDDDSDGEEEGESPSDLPVDGAAPPPGAPRESRSKRRRKKRRERMEAAIVDRASGFWWADQWTRSFEVLYGGGASRARLQKGRSYSRRGQVTELEVGPNGVIARVQGSRPKPYQVRVELNRLRRETWGRILHQLAGKAAFLAQLLDGTLPPEIEDVFFDAGARLFPHGDNDVRSRCTCPDPVVPCKHVAAVHYALAEALQRDPFLLFALRGKSRDQFLQDLRDMRGRDGNRRESAPPLAEDLGRFWRMGRLAESVLRPTGWGSGGDPARLVQSLGEPQLEGIREGLFLPMLESTYRQVSEGMRRLPKDG